MVRCAHPQPTLRMQPVDALARPADALLSCSCRVTIASCNSLTIRHSLSVTHYPSLTIRSYHPEPTRKTNPHPGTTDSSRLEKPELPQSSGPAETCCHTVATQSKSTTKMRQPRKTWLVKQNPSRFHPPATFPRTLSACCRKPTLFSQFQQTSRPSPIHSDSVQPHRH